MRWLIVAALRAVALLPEGVAVQLGVALGGLLWVTRFRRRLVEEQMRLALGAELPPAALAALARAHFRHLGLIVVELLRLPFRCQRILHERCTLRGLEHLDAARAKGKGVLLICGHIGNWELAGLATAQRGFPVVAVVKEMKSGAGNIFLDLLRHPNGLQTIPRRQALRPILRALHDNQVLAFMMDQNMTADEGEFVEFFGRPACTMTGAAVLAARSGATVLTVYAWREPDGRRHVIEFGPPVPLEAPHGDAARDVVHNTQRFTHLLEERIRRHPEQWLWLHHRWRTQPPPPAAPAA